MRLPVLVALCVACLAAHRGWAQDAPSQWQQHPGWELLRAGQAIPAAKRFAADLKAQPGVGAERFAAEVQGLELGWTVAAATAACDLLRIVAAEAPGTPEGRWAALYLRLLYQEDGAVAQSWRERGLPPWKEALVRLLEIYGVPQTDFLLYPQDIAVAPDGRTFKFTSGHSHDQSIVICRPDGTRTDCRLPGQLWAWPDPPLSLCVSGDGSRLYAYGSVPGEVLCFDTEKLAAGDATPVWRYEFPKRWDALRKTEAGDNGSVCLVLASDGRRLLWSKDTLGFGGLDTGTGRLLWIARAEKRRPAGGSVDLDAWWLGETPFRPVATGMSNGAVSADGREVYLPVAVDEFEGAEELAHPEVPGDGRYRIFERWHSDFKLAAWLALDAADGTVLGLRESPWAPPEASQGPSASTVWRATHEPPSWAPAAPAGYLSCATREALTVVVDTRNLEAVDCSPWDSKARGVRCADTTFRTAGGGAPLGNQHRLSFGLPLRIILGPEDISVPETVAKLQARPPDLGGVLASYENTPTGRMRLALALLGAAVASTANAHSSQLPPAWSAYGQPVSAWRALWQAYLRYAEVCSPSRPVGFDRPEAAQKPADPLEQFRGAPSWTRPEWRFSPAGAAVSRDGEWLYVPGQPNYNVPLSGYLSYVDRQIGTRAAEIGDFMYLIRDLVTRPDSDRALAILTPGLATEFDLRRGEIVHHYTIDTLAFGAPVSGGRWLVAPSSYATEELSGLPAEFNRPPGLWLLNGNTGVIEATYALPVPEGYELHVRPTGLLGYSEDGGRLLIPCGLEALPAQTDRRPPARPGQPESTGLPGWAVFDVAQGAVTGYLGLSDVLTPAGVQAGEWVAGQVGVNKASYVFASQTPWTGIPWTAAGAQGLQFPGAAAPITITTERTMISGGGGGGGGITIMVPR